MQDRFRLPTGVGCRNVMEGLTRITIVLIVLIAIRVTIAIVKNINSNNSKKK